MDLDLNQAGLEDPPGRDFRIVPARAGLPTDLREVARMDPYAAAKAFVSGDFQVEGDLVAAIRFFEAQHHPKLPALWHSIVAWLNREWRQLNRHDRAGKGRDIRFHYDRSNEFYAQFLDSRMQYSSAEFGDPERSLEEAQRIKLELICRWLRLKPGDKLLDIGCGWGGLPVYAARRFGASVTGCTLSLAQQRFAAETVRRQGLEEWVQILLQGYRELRGKFDKIVSVGMFEHVGRRHLAEYFERVHALLADGGLFLIRGIVRPEPVEDGPETLFLQESVFPGGELPHLSVLIKRAESAGFEAEEVHNHRKDYGLTCRQWVARLQLRERACRNLVGDRTYRTWLLYLAASAASFENGGTSAVQMVLRKAPA